MAIENRNLAVGTRLVAVYKQQTYTCVIEAGENGDGVVFALQDGQKLSSASAAGSAVMGGKAVNGWRFWSLEGTVPTNPGTVDSPQRRTRGSKKMIFRAPNQTGSPEGEVRWFCSACMKSFYADEKLPEVCPEGHRLDDPKLTGAV